MLRDYDELMKGREAYRVVEGSEQHTLLLGFLEKAQQVATKSLCTRRKCGAVIICEKSVDPRASSEPRIITMGQGYNSPPLPRAGDNWWEHQRCGCPKDELHPKVTDKTCCVHAEQRAIFDMLARQHEFQGNLFNRVMIFTSVDALGLRLPSGMPYCTICSKIALDVGLEAFVLEHEDGIYAYPTDVYHTLSFAYRPPEKGE